MCLGIFQMWIGKRELLVEHFLEKADAVSVISFKVKKRPWLNF